MLANRLLERDKGIGFGAGADVPGAVLITSSLMLGVYTIVKPAAERGMGSSQALLLAAVSLALLGAFIVREATAANPLMPLRIFRERNIAGREHRRRPSPSPGCSAPSSSARCTWSR